MNAALRVTVLISAWVFALVSAGAARAWSEIRAAVAKEASECVSWAPGRIDCFSRTPSGSLSWIYAENGTWSAPHDLGGKLAAPPSCVVRGPGGINCFATSAKGLLATINLNGTAWSKWASLGGDLNPSRVACVALARDRIVCFARARDDRLMSRRWSGGKTWEPWRNLGGALSADPECILVGASGTACFGRGAAGEFVAFLPDAGGRSGGWTTLGGRIEGRPSCVRLRSGEAACAAQGVNGRLHMWRGMPVFAENAGATTQFDDTVTAEPACALQGAMLVCMTRDNQQQLVRRSLGAGADTLHDGVLVAPQAAALTCLSLGPDSLGCVLTGADRKLHFAADRDLEVSKIAPSVTAANESAEGAWVLSNPGTGGKCRVRLMPEVTAFGAKRLWVGRFCRVVGLSSRPAQWNQNTKELLFLGADGQITARFHSTQSGRWISPRGDTALLLTRFPGRLGDVQAVADGDMDTDKIGDDPLFEMLGPWQVLAGGDDPLCTLTLTGARAEAGYAVRLEPECGPRFANVRYWIDRGPALVLVGPDDVALARFDSAAPGEWRSQAFGGVTLKR